MKKFKVGDVVIHLGTPNGKRKGDTYTITGVSNRKERFLKDDGTYLTIPFAYVLDAISCSPGVPVGAAEEWLMLKPDSEDNQEIKHEAAPLSFGELMEWTKEQEHAEAN